ncbi:hypothetical protein [[Kitasatospora] papulosa]|uniref:hypothetical protein n=1 Tax=[Kitasatospora] papulosa TaxID=1464011 RepID=UPI003696EB57
MTETAGADAAPVLRHASYDGKLTVTALWDLVGGATGYVLCVLSGDTVTASQKTSGMQGSVGLLVPPTGNVLHVAVAACQNESQGPWSNRLRLLVDRIGDLTAAYDGTTVTAAWSLNGSLANEALVTVCDADESTVAEAVVTGRTAAVSVPVPLAEGSSVTVEPAFGESVGPGAGLGLITVAPGIRTVSYDASAPATSVSLAGPVPDGCRPAASLQAEDGTERSGTGQDLLVEVPGPVDSARSWSATAAWKRNKVTGPPSRAVGVLPTPPMVRRAEVRPDGAVSVACETLPGPPYPAGIHVLLSAPGEADRHGSISEAVTGTVRPEPALTPGTSYTLRAAPVRGGSQGPWSTPVKLINAGPPITSAVYEEDVLTVNSSGPVPADATSCLVQVLEGSTVLAEQACQGGSSRLPVTLALDGSYAARLRWLSDVGAGCPGPAFPLVTCAASVRHITVTADAVMVAITVPANVSAGVRRYLAELLVGDVVLASSEPVPAVPSTAGEPVAAIPFTAAGAAGLTTRVRALGVDALGPAGPAATVLTTGPLVEATVVRETSLDVTWRLPPDPSGVIASTTLLLVSSGGARLAFPNLPGEHAVLPLDAPLDVSASWTLAATVSGAGGAAVSPSGPPVAVLAGAPRIVSAAFDGRVASAVWAWENRGADAGPATSYQLVLSADGVPVGSCETAGTSAVVTPERPLLATEKAQLAVNALCPGGKRVVAPGPVLPTDAPVLEKVTSPARSEVLLAWRAASDPGHVVTGYEAVLSGCGRETVIPLGAVSPHSAEIPSTYDVFGPLTVAVRATGDAVTGPSRAATPVLRDGPHDLAASVGPTYLDIRWSPAAGEVTGYEIALSIGTTTTTTVHTGTRVTLPFDAPAGTECSAVVTPRHTVAAGPSASLALVTQPPLVGTVAHDGVSLSVDVTPPPPPAPQPTAYRVELLHGSTVVRTAEVPPPPRGASLVLPHRAPVGSEPDALRVRTRSGSTLGPSAEAPVLSGSPVVSRVQVDGAVAVRLGVAPTGSGTLQAALVVDGDVRPPKDADAAGSVLLDRPSTGTTWGVVARAVCPGAVGPWSSVTAVPAREPRLVSVSVAGGTLHVRWAPDSADTHRVAVLFDGQVVTETDEAGDGATLPLDPACSPATARIVLRRADGVALGPADTAPLVTDGCGATTTTTPDRNRVIVSWSAPASAVAPDAFVPVVCWEGLRQQLPEQPADTTSCTVELAGVPPGAWVAVRARAGVCLGPPGNRAPIVRGRPRDLLVHWSAGTLTARWAAPDDPRVDGAVLSLSLVRGRTLETETDVAEWSVPLSAADAQDATITVAARAGHGRGTPTDPVWVIGAAPRVTTVACGPAAVSVTWQRDELPSSVERFQVRVRDGDTTVACAETGASHAVLAVPPAAADRTVAVTAVAPSSRGPESPSTQVPGAGPALTGVTTDAVTGRATVHWAAAGAGTTGYLVQVLENGAADGPPLSLPAGTCSTPLPVGPAAFDALEVTLSVVTTAPGSGITSTTAPGPRLRVPTQPVTLREVSWCGTEVRVAWSPVRGATGYAVAVVAPGHVEPLADAEAPPGATCLTFEARLPDPALSYRVVVQPRVGASTGVRTEAPLFRPCLAVRPATTTPLALPDRVLRATTPALEAETTSAPLPALGPLAPAKLPIATSQRGRSDAPFTLTAAPGTAPLPYVLTIGNGALRFDEDRSTLAGAYRCFLTEVERAGATPQGVLVLQQTIARLMPQTFEETLYYAYGLSAVGGYVDLRPGMVLRVGFSAFDLTAAGGSTAWSNGYSGGPVIDYEVQDSGAGGTWTTGFDAFVEWLVGNGVLRVPGPERPPSSSAQPTSTAADVLQSGAAEAADLASLRQPFHRLLIPGALQAATPPALGRTGQQFTIAGAARWQDIDAATPAGQGGVSVAYFRGRAVLRPCVRVHVGGIEHLVPLGTTLGNVLDRLARRPPPAPVRLLGLRLERANGPVVLEPQQGYRADAMTPVLFEGCAVGQDAAHEVLRLPLLHGDRITFGESA